MEEVISLSDYDEVMVEKTKNPCAGNGARAISKGWVVTENGTEIATITMSITTLSGFREEQVGNLLTKFAETSRSFYLEAGNEFRTEP